MCGISGFVDFAKKSSSELLHIMSDPLSHRGPDGEGTFFSEHSNFQVGLAHKRLAILDLTDCGSQPMQFEKLFITFNGEIYNFKEIRLELLSAGCAFKSNSDTEVILQAYHMWGESCVNRFIGMFAFVIYDSEKQELICIRDRAGVKPFYYYLHNNVFLFASELKSFHKHPSFEKTLNKNAIASFMQFGNIPRGNSIFKHTYKLLPGHILKVNLITKQTEQKCYWNIYDYYNQPKLDISFAEAKEQTLKLLTSASEYRTISDVPIGIFLSGGFDSTCLTAILQANRSDKLKTFTIGVENENLNEAKFASAISERLGTDHTQYYCSGKDALSIVPELAYYYDEPFGDYSAIPTMLVSQLAKKQVTVALSADGGDELFAGYNRYEYLMKEGSRLNKIAPVLLKAAAVASHVIPPSIFNNATRYKKIKSLLYDPSDKNFAKLLSVQFTQHELNDLFVFDFEDPLRDYENDELKLKYYTSLSYIMALDYQTYLVDDILNKVDRASMRVGLEAREPFLDHRIVEFAARLPDNYKYHNHIKKHILKEIVYQFVPKNIMDRPKMGFTVPIEEWLKQDLKEQVLFYLNDERLEKQKIFNPAIVKKIINSFYNGKQGYGAKVWYLLMFQMWHQKWME